MSLETLGRPEKLPGVLAKKDKLVAMAMNGASKTQLYVEMGISKGCASRWSNPEDDRYQPDFVNLIDELVSYSQAHWEGLGYDCLKWEKFQATVYNRQMQGRFKDDWTPQSSSDVTSKGKEIGRDRDVTQKLLAKLPTELLESLLAEIEAEDN